MKYFEFNYKRLGLLQIRVIVMADSYYKARKEIEDETYGWSDYTFDSDEKLKIFDINFVREVDEESRLEQVEQPKIGEYDISSLTQESLKAIIKEAYERGLNEA